MKRRLLTMIVASAVLLTGCQSRENTIATEKKNDQTTSATTTAPTVEAVTTPEPTAESTIHEWTGEPSGEATLETVTEYATGEAPTGEEEFIPAEDGAYFDGVFKGFDSQGVGMYDALDDYILSMSAPEIADNLDSLYLVECVRPLTYKQSNELFGNKERWRQFYEVRLERDLIDGSEPDRTVYIRRSISAEYQTKGFPAYSPGEEFTVLINSEADGFCDVSGFGMLDYDVYSNDAMQWAYSRDCRTFDEAIPDVETIDEYRITSTTKNPAHYTSRLPLDTLSAYMQELFRDNGLTRHFRQPAE